MQRKDDAVLGQGARFRHKGTVQENPQAMCGLPAQRGASGESLGSGEEYDALLFCAIAEALPQAADDMGLAVIQYDPTDFFIDGNGRFTLLIGKNVLDVLLKRGCEEVAFVSGIDVFIDTALPIANPRELRAQLGLWVDNNKFFGLTKKNGWFLSHPLAGLPEGAVHMRHAEDAILVMNRNLMLSPA